MILILVIVMNEIEIVVFRSFFVLLVMFFLFKLMGKKQVSQMNMFDYITGITIGSIAADISLDIEKSIIAGITCLLIYCLVAVVLSYLELKSVIMRKVINGTTTLTYTLRNNMAPGNYTLTIKYYGYSQYTASTKDAIIKLE